MAEKAKDEEVLEIVSKALDKSKPEVISDLVNLLSDMDGKQQGGISELAELLKETKGDKGSVIKDVVEAIALERLLNRDGDGNIVRDVLRWAIPLRYLSPLISGPEQKGMDFKDMFLLMKLADGDNKTLERMLQFQQELEKRRLEEQGKQLEELKNLLWGKQLEQTKKETELKIERIAQALESLEQRIAQNTTPEERKGLVDQIRELSEIRKELKGLLEDEFGGGVVDKSGKPNYAKLIERGLKTVEEIGKSLAQRAPPQQPIQPMPIQIQPRIEQEPKPEPSVELKEEPKPEPQEKPEEQKFEFIAEPEPTPDQNLDIKPTKLPEENIEVKEDKKEEGQ